MQAAECIFACIYVLLHYVCIFFVKNVLTALGGKHILKNDSKPSAFKNNRFESLLGALALSMLLRRALFRQ